MINRAIFSFLIFLFLSNAFAGQLTESEEKSRDKGVLLYQQGTWTSSQPFLRVAAEAGDKKSQYFLGEAIRLSNRYMTKEARNWYVAAADQGDLYAMLRLSSKNDLCNAMDDCATKTSEEWRARALKIARERAAEGNTEAMVVMFTANQGLDWLEKAAESKDSFAQQLLASAYQRGQGWFIVPGSREKAIEKWFKASAEAGFPPGMYLYANYLYEHNGDMSEIGYWLRKTAEAGHIDALVSYALNVAHIPDTYGFPLDLVKAYGFTYLVSELKGGGASPREARINLPQIAEKINAEEIKQGIALSKEWENNHPPLSYYAPIYGY